MNWRVWAELVELKAKTASVLPFAIGMAYSWYHYEHLHLGAMISFFIAMFLFNLGVDILDNYMDYQRETADETYKAETNIIGREQLSLTLVRRVLIGLIGVSALLGTILASQTSWVVFWLGVLSYSVGIFYSAGPKPLSSLPVGEVASGLAMGFIIPLICVYLNVYDQVAFSWALIGGVFLMALPAITGIANLMLANNICDVEEDVLNHRYTLVYYLGKPRSLRLFWVLAALPFISVTVAVCLGAVPPLTLGIWLVAPKIYQQTRQFCQRPLKLESFPLAIKNLAITLVSYAVLFIIGVLF